MTPNIENGDLIKSVVHGFLPDAKVLLFGSRARGDFKKHSDYDVLVVINGEMRSQEKRDWADKINSSLVSTLKAPVDVLVDTKAEVDEKKHFPGHVFRYAIPESIEL